MKCKKSFRTLFLGVLLTVSILPVIIIFQILSNTDFGDGKSRSTE